MTDDLVRTRLNSDPFPYGAAQEVAQLQFEANRRAEEERAKDPLLWDLRTSCYPDKDALIDRISQLERQKADYEEVLQDKRRLTRKLDVAMHGEARAAQQAALCDLIEPARQLRTEADTLARAVVDLKNQTKGGVSRPYIIDSYGMARALKIAERRVKQ